MGPAESDTGGTAHRYTGPVTPRIIFVVLYAWLGQGLLLSSGIAAAPIPRPPSDGDVAPDRYLWTAWGTGAGLPQNSVTALLQTRDGYLWVGTFGGLARFDGVQFTVFRPTNTPVLRGTQVLALVEDPTGALWVTTLDAGLYRYAAGRFEAFSTTEGLPDRNAYAVAVDPRGTVWVMTAQGPAYYRQGRFHALPIRPEIRQGPIGFQNLDTAGGLWWGVGDRLYVYRDGQWTVLPFPYGPAPLVWQIYQDRAGAWWFATEGLGLLRYHEGRWTRYGPEQGLPALVRTVYEDRRGRLWAGAWQAGLFRWTDGRWEPASPDDRVRRRTVRALLEDREGNLWVGTDGEGLYQGRVPRVRTFGQADGLPGDVFVPVVSDDEDGLWLGLTCGGLVHWRPDGRSEHWTERDGLPGGCIWSLLRTRSGDLWVGGLGLVRLRPRPARPAGGGRTAAFEIVRLTMRQGLPSDAVLALYEDTAGRIWVGTEAGLAVLENDAVRRVYRTSDGLVHDWVRFITQDRTGALWVGTRGGLSRWADGRFENFTTRNGLSHDHVRAVHVDAAGRVWVGTYGGGLDLYRNGRWYAFTTATGLPDDFITQVLEDDRGRLWVCSNKGIFRVDPSALEAVATGAAPTVPAVLYDTQDGLTLAECAGGSQPAGAKTPDGILWFPTLRGLARIDPRADNPVPPPVYIEALRTARGLSVPPNGAVVLPPGQNDLEVRYTALSLRNPLKVRFRYRLEGYDADWVEAGTRRSAYYTHVPPGRYRFRVQASNDDGLWNETGAALDLTLRPYLYQTGYFYVLCALGLTGLITGLIRWRLHALTRRARLLETTVAQRTAEVQAQKEALAEMNVRLTQSHEELTQAHADLRQSHEDLLMVFHRLRVGVLTLDAQGRVVFANRVAERLLGRSAEALQGQAWETALPFAPEDLRALRHLLTSPAEAAPRTSVSFVGPDGHRYWTDIEIQADPTHPGGHLLFLYDISEIYDPYRMSEATYARYGLVGQSPPMLQVYRQIEELGPFDTTVLIVGETGTGKELVARALHDLSPRRDRPFIALNCGGLTESVLSSQLFGHRKGAFTGAVTDQVGFFESAHGGTLFLDEIGDMPLDVQRNLLRTLQEREIIRLGETRPRKIDVRILAATHRDLDQEVIAGRFRQDLLYRIRVAEIHLPPLRERRTDIPLLAVHFAREWTQQRDRPPVEISRAVLDALLDYPWPGNVRELRNVVESALVHCPGPVLRVEDLPAYLRPPAPAAPGEPDPDAEKRRLLAALEETHGNISQAARRLGLSRMTLYRKLARWGLRGKDKPPDPHAE